MKKLKLLIVSLALVVASCNPHLVPVKTNFAIAQVEQLEKSVNAFYTSIEGAPDKRYSQHQASYAVINAQINEIAAFDSTRIKSGAILGIVKDIKDRFSIYENLDKEQGELNEWQLPVFNAEMHNLIETLHNSEINYTN